MAELGVLPPEVLEGIMRFCVLDGPALARTGAVNKAWRGAFLRPEHWADWFELRWNQKIKLHTAQETRREFFRRSSGQWLEDLKTERLSLDSLLQRRIPPNCSSLLRNGLVSLNIPGFARLVQCGASSGKTSYSLVQMVRREQDAARSLIGCMEMDKKWAACLTAGKGDAKISVFRVIRAEGNGEMCLEEANSYSETHEVSAFTVSDGVLISVTKTNKRAGSAVRLRCLDSRNAKGFYTTLQEFPEHILSVAVLKQGLVFGTMNGRIILCSCTAGKLKRVDTLSPGGLSRIEEMVYNERTDQLLVRESRHGAGKKGGSLRAWLINGFGQKAFAEESQELRLEALLGDREKGDLTALLDMAFYEDSILLLFRDGTLRLVHPNLKFSPKWLYRSEHNPLVKGALAVTGDGNVITILNSGMKESCNLHICPLHQSPDDLALT